jgi:ankyrin repeat protein
MSNNAKKFLRLCQGGDVDGVVSMLDADQGLLEAKDAQGATGLHRAAREGRDDVLRLLLDRGLGANVVDNKMVTALHEACSNARLGCAKLLLERGAATNRHKANSSLQTGGFTPLHCAAANGHYELAELLIQHDGCGVAGRDRAGECPLSSAVRSDNSRLVALLLDSGAVPYIQSLNGRTCLHVAALHGRREIARILLEHARGEAREAELLLAADCGGSLAAHEAAAGGHVDMLEVLVDAGTPIDSEDSGGRTPLQVAGEERRREAAEWLIRKGALKHIEHDQVKLALEGTGHDEDLPHSFLHQAIVKVGQTPKHVRALLAYLKFQTRDPRL